MAGWGDLGRLRGACRCLPSRWRWFCMQFVCCMEMLSRRAAQAASPAPADAAQRFQAHIAEPACGSKRGRELVHTPTQSVPLGSTIRAAAARTHGQQSPHRRRSPRSTCSGSWDRRRRVPHASNRRWRRCRRRWALPCTGAPCIAGRRAAPAGPRRPRGPPRPRPRPGASARAPSRTLWTSCCRSPASAARAASTRWAGAASQRAEGCQRGCCQQAGGSMGQAPCAGGPARPPARPRRAAAAARPSRRPPARAGLLPAAAPGRLAAQRPGPAQGSSVCGARQAVRLPGGHHPPGQPRHAGRQDQLRAALQVPGGGAVQGAPRPAHHPLQV
jgi:hypothetical protein